MLQFGGWMTVSSVVGPVIVYADRFVIVALVSAAALAYYTAPFEVVSRLLLLPTALTTALFPALAATASLSSHAAMQLRTKAAMLVFATVAPITLAGALLAPPLLTFWLGGEFAENSARVTQILLIGFLFNSLAQIPLSSLHSFGAAKQPAMLHLAELPVYLVLLVTSVRYWGLEGAAWAWTLRSVVDYALMSALLRRFEARVTTRTGSIQVER